MHGYKQADVRDLEDRGFGGAHMYPHLCRRRSIDIWSAATVASMLE